MELIIAIIILLIMAVKEEPAIIGKILIVILILIVFAGNLLLFSGQTSSENGFVIFVAVIVDIILFIFTIVKISKKVGANAKEKEKKRIERVESQISEIKSKYSPKKLSFSINEAKSKITFDTLYINTDINITVKKFKKSMSQIISECKTVDYKLNRLVSYNSDPDSVLKYLSENIQEIQELKEQSDSLHAKIYKKRIVLLNEDGDAIECIKQAFIRLKKSKKCSSDNVPISALVDGKKPLELNMFSYKYEPLVLSLHDLCYCFFGNVILVFDDKGIYLNALDPTILRLSVERYVESVYKSDDNYQNSRNTDNDSRVVTSGETRQIWTHTRIEDLIDLIHSYNPRVSHHTDEIMYGKVSFYLSEKINYTFSSYQAIIALEKAKAEYEKRYNNRRDALPDFLNLMQMLAPENAMMDDISKKCKGKSTSYFCKIT